jgi:dihydroxyacid dehydratase/phosphogluconate dehydratase
MDVCLELQTGDMILLDSENGLIEVLDFYNISSRAAVEKTNVELGFGRELFRKLQSGVSQSEEGASFIV